MIRRGNRDPLRCRWIVWATCSLLPIVVLGLGMVPALTSEIGSISPADWTIQTGAGGWGNNELQTYTKDAVRFGKDGRITITAKVDSSNAREKLTSGRITTAGRWSFVEGTLTARLRLPEGKGLLPAFWLLGDDLDRVGWPACGEIDIVERPNTAGKAIHTLHGPLLESPAEQWQQSATSIVPEHLRSSAHEYSVSRGRDRVVISVDGRMVLEQRRAQLPVAYRWVFDRPMHVLLSLAIGGNWPGPPDSSTPPTASFEVEWIRFDRSAIPGP